jgi:hypothetical protein
MSETMKVLAVPAVVAVFAILAISPAWSTRNTIDAGRCPDGKPPARTITKIQSIQLDLLRRSSFNNMDGTRVTNDLLQHRQLWCAAILDRVGNHPLIKLRDIDQGYWNADTVYILSSGANNPALSKLARRWDADAIQWVTGADASQLLGTSERYQILEIWWD